MLALVLFCWRRRDLLVERTEFMPIQAGEAALYDGKAG